MTVGWDWCRLWGISLGCERGGSGGSCTHPAPASPTGSSIQAVGGETEFRFLRPGPERESAQGTRTSTASHSVPVELGEKLHRSVDGVGLRYHNLYPQAHRWLHSDSLNVRGKDFVHAIQLRGGLIPTPLRRRRIDPNVSVVCDYCRGTTTASLSHILQSCGRTHGRRIDRHNYVVKYAVGVMRQKGFEVLLEPRIRYGHTFRKPDIVAWHSNAEHAFVVDVTVTGDGWEPDDAHLQKVDYYSQGEIKEWVKRVSGKATVRFGSATLNWRGAWSPLSVSFLREMGFATRDYTIMSQRTLVGGWAIWRMWACSLGGGLEFRLGESR